MRAPTLDDRIDAMARYLRCDLARRKETARFGAFVQTMTGYDAQGRPRPPWQCPLCRAFVPFDQTCCTVDSSPLRP